jgi:glycerol-1-phosphate dehydrogenase [NAD(P)+]
VLLKIDRQERVFVAVGSGTITDISRLVSHRTRTSFVSLPTAPSVDGFTSIGAPIIAGGIKKSYICHPPTAVFADLPTLQAAPAHLIASGFGDMLGKLVSAADWKLGHILNDEPYDPEIAQRSYSTALACASQAAQIGKATEAGVRTLIEGLIQSGFCMLDFGDSQPASGAEHHISHFWEVMRLQKHQPYDFHGRQVGVASVISAGWYGAIRELSRAQAAALLSLAHLPDPQRVTQQIREVYGPIAEQILADQAKFIHMPEQDFQRLKQRIIDRWDEVLEVAQMAPTAAQMADWLRQAGAPTTGAELGSSETEVQLGKDFGHYYRSRFTINKLRFYLGIR